MTISTDLAISNNMSRFVPKCLLNWQILVDFSMNFVDKDRATKVYVSVHQKSRGMGENLMTNKGLLYQNVKLPLKISALATAMTVTEFLFLSGIITSLL